jgi:hypothetical protein
MPKDYDALSIPCFARDSACLVRRLLLFGGVVLAQESDDAADGATLETIASEFCMP